MAITRIDLADLQQTEEIVDSNGRPTPRFLRFLNGTIRSLKNGVNSLIDIQNATTAAQNAANAANIAAAAAGAAATASKRDTALINSWIAPASVISATPTTITVAAHTRFYSNGTSAAVSGGTVATTGPSVVNYVSYVDVPRTGGAVTYVAGLTQPTQIGDTHVVGAVTVPSSGSSGGGNGPPRPGQVIP
jgi:hypothetical protein